jgi:hypothetical protein
MEAVGQMQIRSKQSQDVDTIVVERIAESARAVEEAFDATVLSYCGPISEPGDSLIRTAIEHRIAECRDQRRLAVLLTTSGGSIEVAERIANTLRHHYQWVAFVIPDHAMSAGTVLAMCGDEIWMDYFSFLGPIDPQVKNRDGKWVPALGYLNKYDALMKKALAGGLSTAEMAILLEKFDQGDLFLYEQARDLSIELLEQWLVRYKFKEWKVTASRKTKVTAAMKSARAKEIADALSSPDKWKSHGRGLSKAVLWDLLKLHIDDLEKDTKGLKVKEYHSLVEGYRSRLGQPFVVHTGDLYLAWGRNR